MSDVMKTDKEELSEQLDRLYDLVTRAKLENTRISNELDGLTNRPDTMRPASRAVFLKLTDAEHLIHDIAHDLQVWGYEPR